MGGEISVQSQEGRGSLFTFTIPLQAARDRSVPPAAAGPQESPEARPAIRILLVEDEPMIRDMITMMLAKRGWQVDTAGTGKEALEKAGRGRFDLILMDLQLPEMNGLEATRAIRDREMEGEKHSCIIGLTAHARRGIREECLEGGMDRVLTKPVQMDELSAAITECIWRMREGFAT